VTARRPSSWICWSCFGCFGSVLKGQTVVSRSHSLRHSYRMSYESRLCDCFSLLQWLLANLLSWCVRAHMVNRPHHVALVMSCGFCRDLPVRLRPEMRAVFREVGCVRAKAGTLCQQEIIQGRKTDWRDHIEEEREENELAKEHQACDGAIICYTSAGSRVSPPAGRPSAVILYYPLLYLPPYSVTQISTQVSSSIYRGSHREGIRSRCLQLLMVWRWLLML
jgi:hypothetical protein